MSKNSGFDYHEYQVWVNKLQKIIQSDFDSFLRRFLLEMGQRVLTKTRPRTPVDTGYLKASWTLSDVAVVGRTFLVTISTNAEYASYVEYGHHSYPGRYMLSISIDEVQKQIPARFDKEFREFIGKYGV